MIKMPLNKGKVSMKISCCNRRFLFVEFSWLTNRTRVTGLGMWMMGVLTREMVFPVPQVAETKTPQSADVIGVSLLYDYTMNK